MRRISQTKPSTDAGNPYASTWAEACMQPLCFQEELFIPPDITCRQEFRERVLKPAQEFLPEAAKKFVRAKLNGRRIEEQQLQDLLFSVHLAVHELASNAVFHGLLGIDSRRKLELMQQMSADGAKTNSVLAELLKNEEVRRRSARITVEVTNSELKVTFWQTGGIPGFEDLLEEIKASQKADCRPYGRGLKCIIGLFDTVMQDPTSQIITFSKCL